MSPRDAAPVLPGETLAGKYRVERVLGRGGMGIVVAARHLELDERVAIKFLLRRDDPVAVERFVREARTAAKVKSEHVCRVYDVARLATGEPYLVMEYLDGIDLSNRLRAEGRLPIADVARWMIELCAALADAHALGIVHRDLKPANVFLAKRADATFTVKVLDFGISKLPSSEGMTSTTAVIGTPIYMSPEQVASSRDVDHRSDIWSLGVIMYELVSGRPPFAGDSLIQLSVKIREADLPPLESGDRRFDAIVARCLAKERDARWSSVQELAAVLAPFAGEPPSTDLARRASRAPTALSPPELALAVTALDERGAPRADADGHAQRTLEPLSHAKASDPAHTKPWPRMTLTVGVVLVASLGLVGVKVTGGEPAAPPMAADPPPASTSAADPPPASTSANDVLPAEPPSASAPVASTSPAPPPAKPCATKTVASTTAAFDASATSPAARPTPKEETPSAKKRRELDRGDPLAF